jgi:hypothetical protein
MGLLVGLGLFEACRRIPEVGAAVLPVAVEEEIVEPVGQVVVMRDVARRASPPVDQRQLAHQLAAAATDRLARLSARLPGRVRGHQIEQVENVSLLEDQPTVHVGFADADLRVAEDVADDLVVGQPQHHPPPASVVAAIGPRVPLGIEQPVRVAEHEGRAQPVTDRLAEQPVEELDEGGVARRLLDRSEDRDGEAAARPQDAPQLAECGHPIGEEHQAELADHGVEIRVRKGQRLGRRQAPLDAGRYLAGDLEHLGVEVEADHRAVAAHPLGHGEGQAPVPQATSSTRCPGRMSAARVTTGPHCANSAGTKDSS